MLAIILSPVYVLLNVYFLFRLFIWLKNIHVKTKKWYVRVPILVVYIFFASAMIVGFFLPKGSDIKAVMVSIGNYWYGVGLYTTIALIVADLSRFIVIVTKRTKLRTRTVHILAGILCLVFIISCSTYGVIHAGVIYTTNYEVSIDKKAGNIKSMNVVLVADLHMGYNIRQRQIKQMVEKINASNPDLVVIAGDIFDNDYDSLDNPDELINILNSINSKYGVYACYGNHDISEKIMGGFTFRFDKREKRQSDIRMDEFLEKANIKLLRDEYVLIDNSFYLYGRPDAKRPGRDIEVRKTPDELVEGLDQSKPIVVIDHQPSQLDELANAGVDLDLCGHTHDGQLFPLNITCSLIWENSYGYLKKGNMHNIVTSGVGLYGPFMRVGTDAEICSIKVSFQ